jgi:hypothetical protein
MASFTPSALTVQSVGSMNMTIAHFNEDILSGTNYWASGINGIRSIQATMFGGTALTASSTYLVVSWTASNGTIHIVTDDSQSNTGYALWVLSGGPATLA